MPPTTACTTIDDVIAGLDSVIARAVEEGDRIGYFACLYRHVTVEVQQAIERGEFDDDDRMCRFDAAFGNRYFGPLRRWRDGADPPGDAWREAWRNARILAGHPVEDWDPLVAVLDDRATALARIVARPKWFLRPALDVIRRAERDDVGTVVERLAGALDPAPA